MSNSIDLYNDNLIDPKKEIEGVIRKISSGVSVRVARANNPEYRRLLRRKYKGSRGVLEQDDDTAMELSDELMQEVYAHTVLKDIIVSDEMDADGVTPKYVVTIDGEAYRNGDYDPQIGLKILKNEPFRNKIKSIAEDQAAFMLFGDETAGNGLKQLSAGT